MEKHGGLAQWERALAESAAQSVLNDSFVIKRKAWQSIPILEKHGALAQWERTWLAVKGPRVRISYAPILHKHRG